MAAWIIICAPRHDGGICPRTRDNGVCSPKGDKTSYLSKTLQVFAKSIAGERRTTSGDFDVVWDALPLSPSLTRLNKPPMKTRHITHHQGAEFRHVVKLPEERKAQQVFPESWEEAWKRKCFFHLIRPRRNPSFNRTSKKIWHITPDTYKRQPPVPAWGRMPKKYKTTHFFYF